MMKLEQLQNNAGGIVPDSVGSHSQKHGAKMLYTLDKGLLSAGKLLKVHASRGIKT